MASTPDSFKNRLIPILTEAGVTDPSTLDKVATALSQALHDYITQDVQVAMGIPTNTGSTTGPGRLF